MSDIVYTPPPDAVLADYKRMLQNLGYYSAEVTEEPPNYPNPTFAIVKDPKTSIVSLVIIGNAFSYVTERTIRFFRNLRIIPQHIEVFDLDSDDLIFEVKPGTTDTPFYTFQKKLADKNWADYDFRIVIQLSSIGKQTRSSIPQKSPVQDKKKASKKKTSAGMPFVTPFKPSPVMVKPRKLSQLKLHEQSEEELLKAAQSRKEAKEKEKQAEKEKGDEIQIPTSVGELSENEKIILKEILKRPKRKVQSNHIRKITGLDQDVIRNTLRELVDKNILRVSSGWYILKKSIAAPLSSKTQDSSTTKRATVRSESRQRRLMSQIEAEAEGRNRGTKKFTEEPVEAPRPTENIAPYNDEADFFDFPSAEEEDSRGGRKRKDIDFYDEFDDFESYDDY